jgi:AcrR family transcriptional regulator
MTESTPVADIFNQTLEADATLTTKQRKILQAALDLFAEKGFDHTTTGDIAERAGVAEGTVYKRYKTKRDLLMALLAPFANDVVPKAANEFIHAPWSNSHASLHDLLWGLISNRIDFIIVNYRIIKILAVEAISDSTLRDHVITTVGGGLMNAIMPHIHELKAQGLVVDWPDDVIIQFIVGTMFSFAIRLIADMPTADVEAQKQYMVELLEKGLAPK